MGPPGTVVVVLRGRRVVLVVGASVVGGAVVVTIELELVGGSVVAEVWGDVGDVGAAPVVAVWGADDFFFTGPFATEV